MDNWNRKMKKYNLSYLELIALVSVFIAVCFSLTPTSCYWTYLPIRFADLLNAIAVSIIAAYAFYWFQVKIPEQKVKKNFKNYVALFKKDIIQDILDIAYQDMIRNNQYRSLGIDSEVKASLHESGKILLPNQEYIMNKLALKLMSENAFRCFFKLEAGEGQTMWNRFQNGLNKTSIKQFLERLDLLREETHFLLVKASVENEYSFQYLKRLSEAIYRVKYHSYEEEDIRSFSDLIWTMMTGWSFSSGYNEKGAIDAVAKNI